MVPDGRATVEVAPTAFLYVLVTKGCWTSMRVLVVFVILGPSSQALLTEENIALAPTVADLGSRVELQERCGRCNSEYVTVFLREVLPLLLRHEMRMSSSVARLWPSITDRCAAEYVPSSTP